MISDQQRYELKTRFGNVFSAELGKKEYIFRPLTLQEYRYIISILDDSATDADLEDYVVKMAVVDPPNVDLDKMKAGHVSSLADQILKISGFTDVNFLVESLENTRKELEEASYMMKAFILAAMPAYTEEDLDQLSIVLLIRKLALAEKILGVQQAASGLPPEAQILFAFGSPEGELIDPAAEQKTQAPINKEKLLSKVVATERETSGKSISREALAEFDEQTLLHMAGTPKGRDPIAEKLRQALQ